MRVFGAQIGIFNRGALCMSSFICLHAAAVVLSATVLFVCHGVISVFSRVNIHPVFSFSCTETPAPYSTDGYLVLFYHRSSIHRSSRRYHDNPSNFYLHYTNGRWRFLVLVRIWAGAYLGF